MLKVNEIFYSIQGEGFHTGMAMIFIRLAGCNMKCSFCDTKYSWKKNRGRAMEINDVIDVVKKFSCNSVCITGGEPTEQNLIPLTNKLKELGYFITLETNGSQHIKGIFDWISVSPKKYIMEESIIRANELKLIVGSKKDIYNARGFYYITSMIYLQPQDNGKKNIDLCVEEIKLHPWLKLSLQLQKMGGFR